jgi:hypothetical protein
MHTQSKYYSLTQAFRQVAMALTVAACTVWTGHAPAQTTSLTLGNPDWNITLTDYGYSDFLLDNTPGFQGREYLSGEWGAAVGYQLSGGTTVSPQWLEPQFSYPDWTTNSTFHVVSAITPGVLNADNLPTAQSVISNNQVEITIHYEMLDTVTGTPMGCTPATAGGVGTFINSNRYVLKQTYSMRNVSGAAISNLQFFQLLHGLQSQRGMYDNRHYAGQLSEFSYDVTAAGVDAWAISSGSSDAGLEDFIGFHARVAPTGYEIGHYGIEGNGIDNHSLGKPSDGVHFSVEDNWQTTPYATRLGTDSFAPAQRWIAGAARWNIGNLAAGASVSHEVVLTLRTGTRVTTGTIVTGACNGGSSAPGGLDYQFDNVTTEGSCFGGFTKATEAELAVRIAAGELSNFTFPTPGSPAQIWDVEFSGTYTDTVDLTLAYDPTMLPAGFDESTLAIHHCSGNVWQLLQGTVDLVRHTITVNTNTLGSFALGVDGGMMFNIAASEAPANSGSVAGYGAYAQAASVTLVAAPNPAYVFANWTEDTTIVSHSPSFTFAATADRTLVANFAPVGSAMSVSTHSSPSNGGATSGDAAYAPETDATVVATKNPGFKFSKWTENGVKVNGAGSSYTFTVTRNRSLVAVFTPVYSVTVTCDPPMIGDDKFEAQADSLSYKPGEMVTMEVNHIVSGYSFVDWTENGMSVSKLAGFTFNSNGNRNLVANFAPGNRVDLSANPKTAGVFSGDGVYPAGSFVTLQAEAKFGYIFKNWTLNGNAMSISPSYTFTTNAQQALVANFVAWFPVLSHVRVAPDSLMLAWPVGASGWLLQESPDLDAPNWMDSTRTVDVAGDENQVTVAPLTGSGFFRLRHP